MFRIISNIFYFCFYNSAFESEDHYSFYLILTIVFRPFTTGIYGTGTSLIDYTSLLLKYCTDTWVTFLTYRVLTLEYPEWY